MKYNTAADAQHGCILKTFVECLRQWDGCNYVDGSPLGQSNQLYGHVGPICTLHMEQVSQETSVKDADHDLRYIADCDGKEERERERERESPSGLGCLPMAHDTKVQGMELYQHNHSITLLWNSLVYSPSFLRR